MPDSSQSMKVVKTVNVYIINYRYDQIPLTGDDGMVLWFETPNDVIEKVRQIIKAAKDQSQYPISIKVHDIPNLWYAKVTGSVIATGQRSIEDKILRFVYDEVNRIRPVAEWAEERERKYREHIKEMERRLLE